MIAPDFSHFSANKIIYPVMKTMYAIIPEMEYHELNTRISELLGYPDKTGTQVYNTTEPDVVDGFCVMPITVEVQEVAPEICEGLELVSIKPELQHEEIPE